MKWALEMIGILLLIAVLTGWTKGPEWIGTEFGKVVAGYQTTTTCQ